ncbi:MAG: DUF4229 domain-containing protein [Geodermatophilaceae bacterium]|nr:DUF4229 domain-containing protein [Geodermatophilaceae bacterium]
MIKPLAIYLLGRLAAFAILLALLWAVGVDGFVAVLIALVVSVPLSYVVLRRQRDDLTAALLHRAQRKAVEREELRSQLRGR